MVISLNMSKQLKCTRFLEFLYAAIVYHSPKIYESSYNNGKQFQILMGLTASVTQNSLWTNEELEEIEKIGKFQDELKNYIINSIYNGIQIRTGRKSQDPIAPFFVEPIPELYDKTLESDNILAKENLLDSIPSSVMVDSKANMKIIFGLNDIIYHVKWEDYSSYRDYIRSNEGLPPKPSPPECVSATKTSIEINWRKSLPIPVGIISRVEIHYSIMNTSATSENSNNRWLMLVSRSFNNNIFFDYLWKGLLPGSKFLFRIRYRTISEWSEFSEATSIISTFAEVPAQPDPPKFSVVTSCAVELHWDYPSKDNGAKVFEYILRGRSSGDEFVDLYRGPDSSYLILDLFPGFAYSFQVAAINSIGISEFSELTSLQTPPRPRTIKNINNLSSNSNDQNLDEETKIVQELREKGYSFEQIQFAQSCETAWKVYWDPKTEQEFYFNTILSFRQLKRPAVLTKQDHIDQENFDSATLKKRQEKKFRSKRYQLLRDLRSTLSPKKKEPMTETSSSSNINDSVANKNESVISIEIRRDQALSDCYKVFNKLKLEDFKRKFKFEFVGEDGIDSGGLSKEAFLIISKEAFQYVGPKYHCWLKAIRCCQNSEVDFQVKTSEVDQSVDPLTEGLDMHESIEEGLFFSSDNEIAYQKTRQNTTSEKNSFSFTELDKKMKISKDNFFVFLGKFIAKALYDKQLICFPASNLLASHLTGNLFSFINKSRLPNVHDQISQENVIKMLEATKFLDYDIYSELTWMAKNDITNTIFENFCVQDGELEVELCSKGSSKEVDELNKFDYIRLKLLHHLVRPSCYSLETFLNSFFEIIPPQTIKDSQLTSLELRAMLVGKVNIDVDELRAYAIYQCVDDRFDETHEISIWFWKSFREFDDESKKKLLLFFTGSTYVPLDGYDPPINITLGLDMELNSLPRAHTCFNQIVLPQFTDFSILRHKVLFAIENTQGFALA